MKTNDNVIEFENSDAAVAKIFATAVEQQDYWKAIGLLNSLLGKNQKTWVKKLALDLHSRLPHYAAIKDDFVPLIVSGDVEAVLAASRGIVNYFLRIDEDVSEFYSDFVEKRLSSLGLAFDKEALHENFGIPTFENTFRFVEIDDGEREILQKADKALNESELPLVKEILENAKMTGPNDAISKKIQAEALWTQGCNKDAHSLLCKVADENKDIYYYALLARVLFAIDKQKATCAAKKMLQFEIEAEEHIIFVSETLLNLKMPNEAIQILKKHEGKYQYFAPFQFAKGLTALELEDLDCAKDAFLKCYLLSNRNVFAYEMYLCIEEKIKLPKELKINDNLPKVIIKRVYDRIASLFSLEYEDLKNLQFSKLFNIMYWVEELRDDEVAEKVVMLFLTFEKGVEVVKNELLSLSCSDWIKKLCIKMLILAGASDITIWFALNDVLKSVTAKLPKQIETEFEFAPDFDKSAKNVFELFFMAYATAFSDLAFEESLFEGRLQEIGEYYLKEMLEMDKKDQKSVNIKTLTAALLYSTCSNDLPFDVEKPKVECSKFSTLENAAGECDALAMDVQAFIKKCF